MVKFYEILVNMQACVLTDFATFVTSADSCPFHIAD